MKRARRGKRPPKPDTWARKADIGAQRGFNRRWAEESRRQTFVTNAQAEHDKIWAALRTPGLKLPYANFANRRASLEKMIREAGGFTEPGAGIPVY